MSVPLLDVPGTNSALSQAEAIEALLARLDAAARQQTDATAFYQQMLHELVGALSAVSAAVWCESDRGLDCLERVGSGTSSQEELPEDAERRLAATVLLGGETRLIAPGAMLPGSEQRNDSGRLQCLSPRAADGVPGLVLRLSLRPDVTLGARETASGVLDAAAEMALAFQLQHRLRWLHQQEEFWSRLDSAILQMNSSPKYSAATRAIAEQVRWLLGCDRVSLLVRRGSRCRIAAISSAAESDRRARQVRLVEQLATDAVNGAGEFEVQVGSGTSPLRVSDSVDAYFDETQLRTVRCTPLQLANDRQSRPIGCLVIDSYSAAPTEVWQKTLDVLGPHCAQTL
ncbi:MAG: hypothetical protein KDA75_17425, partial [Planctomycetaceae bacterium]|nr:hypothetical protein [Planctomycetaceae bacterium]